MNKTGFFEEAPGVKSSIRLMSFIVLVFTIVFIWGSVVYNKQPIDANFIALVTLLLTSAFVPKVLQKDKEGIKTTEQ